MSIFQTWKRRIAYGSTDMAGNIIWQMVSTYLLFYYTTVAGISAAFAGMLFFVVRFIDAFDALIYGYLIDHTHTKYGQSRPYFVWFGIPLGLLAMSLFMISSFGGNTTMRLVYISITYTFFSLIYSGANTPITSILPSLTDDSVERTKLASARMVMTTIGTSAVAAITLPMVKLLGKGNQSKGFTLWAIILGLVIMGLFIFAFLNLKETNGAQNPDGTTESAESLSIWQSLKGAASNKPWLLLACSFILLQTFWMLRGNSAIFFIKYVYGRPELAPIFLGIGFVSVIGNLSVPFLSQRFKNRNVLQFSLVLGVIGQLLLPIAEKMRSVSLLIAGSVIFLIAMGITFTIVFAMLSDTVDYSTKVLGLNETGFLSAVPMIGAKLGMGIGGFLSGQFLAWGQFNAKAAVQSGRTITFINLAFIWMPIILLAAMIFMMQFYRLDEKELQANKAEAAAKVEPKEDVEYDANN
ncbi:MFS transporter [Lactiplantibacillus plantarum]|uniref:MFS transporter n=1 Tax=Lactiplantibacillus plantarum TaxID=1590 RepID=UPI003F538BA7